MLTASQARSNAAYRRRHTTALACHVRKEYAERVRAVMRDNGDTVNAVLRQAVNDYMKAHGEGGTPEGWRYPYKR